MKIEQRPGVEGPGAVETPGSEPTVQTPVTTPTSGSVGARDEGPEQGSRPPFKDPKMSTPTTLPGLTSPALGGPGLRQPIVSSPLAVIDAGKPALWHELARAFSVDLAMHGGQPTVMANIDAGKVRDLIAGSEVFRREQRNFLTGVLDAGTVWFLWDVIGGTAEHYVSKWSGKSTQYKGVDRFLETVGKEGLGAFSWKGVDLHDGNPGGVNTVHWMPYLLAASYMRGCGYDPVYCAIGGVFANLVLHETFAECWEQPKSGHDFIMNSLGAIFGAFPGLGVEYQLEPATGMPTSKFYVKDGDDRRYFMKFEQIWDWAQHPDKLSREQNLGPGMEYNIGVGAQIGLNKWLEVNGGLTFMGDTESTALKVKDVRLEAGVRIKVP